MEIELHKRGDVCILDIVGELSFGEPTGTLHRRAAELIADGERLFVLNLTRSPWLDSSGIGEVVEFHKRARERRGVVKLVLNDQGRTLFTLTQLQKMFDIFDDLDVAVASFDEPGGRYRERI